MNKILTLVLIALVGAGSSIALAKKKETKTPSQTKTKTEVSYLGGGCFWGVQDLIRKQPGVTYTEVGYMGDDKPHADYELVHTGKTEFAETVKIEFDPKKISYEKLLKYFFKIHDPTTQDQQGNDRGRQYRSVIFFTSAEQKKTAEKLIATLNKDAAKNYKNKIWKNDKITTEITEALKWNKAEEYHQDYLVKNPEGYTCHFERPVQF
jgi:methionine-S-sulfoxide reductase